VNFEVPQGRYAMLMGRTGCGKTTILEAVCGLKTVEGGRIVLSGRDVTRLKPGARTVTPDPSLAAAPCDAIVGECGPVVNGRLLQAKGFPYTLAELLGDDRLAHRYANGTFATLRLKSSMYHRFHAPVDCRISAVNYISGDTWNVNPVALKCIEKLFCGNERAVIELHLPNPAYSITLVPVAAVLVASMQIHCLDKPLDLRYRGPNLLPCDAHLDKGEEMGYFQHGSTIVVLASKGIRLADDLRTGRLIRMGEPLLRMPADAR